LYGLAIATAVAASAVDATEKRLPNALTYPLAGGGGGAWRLVCAAG